MLHLVQFRPKWPSQKLSNHQTLIGQPWGVNDGSKKLVQLHFLGFHKILPWVYPLRLHRVFPIDKFWIQHLCSCQTVRVTSKQPKKNPVTIEGPQLWYLYCRSFFLQLLGFKHLLPTIGSNSSFLWPLFQNIGCYQVYKTVFCIKSKNQL